MKTTFLTCCLSFGLLASPIFAGDALEDFAKMMMLKESKQTLALISAGEKFLEDHAGSAANEMVLFTLGGAYQGQKQYDDAIRIYSEMIEKHPESSLKTDIHMQRGEAYRLSEKLPASLPDFQIAYEGYHQTKHTNAAHAQYHIVQAHHAAKDLDNAKAQAALLKKDYPTSSYAKNAEKLVAGGAAKPAEKRYLDVGIDAPDVEFVHLDSGEKKKLSDFKGKVVVIDFWASWCGPCQAPMAKMQTYREKHPEWGEGVELIALSIDKTEELAKNHLESRGWDQTYNAWGGEGGFSSAPPKAYGVRGIPTLYVIDQKGEIAAAGHPNSVDVPKFVDDLIKDKPRGDIF